MRKISAILNISMDRVIQAPGRSDEDTRGGFDRRSRRLFDDRGPGGDFELVDSVVTAKGVTSLPTSREADRVRAVQWGGLAISSGGLPSLYGWLR